MEVQTTQPNGLQKEFEYTPLGSDVKMKLSLGIARKYFAKATASGAEATDEDVMKFIMLCKARALNPWEGDAYLQGYDSNAGPQFSLITAHQAFLKRSELNVQFDGMESGVVVTNANGDIEEYQGDLVREGDTLIGGWAKVYRKDRKIPTYRRLKLSTFTTNRSRWAKDPAGMIVKCFDENTEVLTTNGFEKFANAEGSILQVSERGLEKTDSVPFFQNYTGPMVVWNSRNGNFCVTPNHDMPISFNGNPEAKMEASGLLKLKQRDKAFMPLTMPHSREDAPVSDDSIRMSAVYLADGSDYSTGGGFCVSVSRADKIEFLSSIGSHTSVSKTKDAGRKVTLADGRVITTKSDKTAFYYSRNQEINLIVSRGKKVNIDTILTFSRRQAKLFIDTWLRFDGYKPSSMIVGRIYTSRPDHITAIEVASVVAGYSVNKPKPRISAGCKPNYMIAITDRDKIWLSKQLISEEKNQGKGVWCVTVPSGKIVVRRNGFSHVCHQCAEGDSLRSSFPLSLGGLYLQEETQPIDVSEVPKETKRGVASTVALPKPRTEVIVDAPKTRPEPKPEADHSSAANDPEPASTPEPTPQVKLGKFLFDAGVTFDQFKAWAIGVRALKASAELWNNCGDVADQHANNIIEKLDVSDPNALKIKKSGGAQ